jgi:hypothetical protein
MTDTKLDLEHIREVMVANIRPGDRVTILVPSGIGRNGQEYSERTGRAVICSGTHVALNMGGRYGTPGVATPKNIVRVNSRKDARQ